MGEEKGGKALCKFNSDLYKEHTLVLCTGQKGEEVEGKLHLITVVYSLHPLDKFTSLKEISRSVGMGVGAGLC